MKPWTLIALMFLTVAVVAGLSFWSTDREDSAALRDFAREQAALAQALSSALAGESGHREPPAQQVPSLIRHLESTGTRLVLLQPPGATALETSEGRSVQPASLMNALQAGRSEVQLSREEAASLGLPKRRAVAGLFPAAGTDWSVVVVASAAHERDRLIRSLWRQLISIMVAAGIVIAFGGIALREQRKELALTAELRVAAAREQRQAELQRADKLATLGTLATGITHEIATPLGVISGRAEQLKLRVGDDARSRRALDAILNETDRIEQIARSFLTLARGEAPMTQDVAPETLVREAQHLVEHRFRKAGVPLSITLPGRLPHLACNARLMVQALVNLTLNACDACQDGGRVEIRANAVGDKLELVVEDEGVGISEEAARRATEPFFTTKTADQGTGLGLAIASEIIKHHRGALEIGPRAEGRGTVASILLPVSQEQGVA